MVKPKRNIGLEILQGLREIKRGEHGRVINVPSVTSIRERTGLSQARFAELLGVSVRTLQESQGSGRCCMIGFKSVHQTRRTSAPEE